jgi:hypothetical protein
MSKLKQQKTYSTINSNHDIKLSSTIYGRIFFLPPLLDLIRSNIIFGKKDDLKIKTNLN